MKFHLVIFSNICREGMFNERKEGGESLFVVCETPPQSGV